MLRQFVSPDERDVQAAFLIIRKPLFDDVLIPNVKRRDRLHRRPIRHLPDFLERGIAVDVDGGAVGFGWKRRGAFRHPLQLLSLGMKPGWKKEKATVFPFETA